jgi:hypothetical protein
MALDLGLRSSESPLHEDEDIMLNPSAGFAIKTVLVSATTQPNRTQGTKVFINVCSDPRVPEPEGGYGSVIMDRVQNGEDWIVPMVLSEEKNDTDKKGRSCHVWDCCMHPRVIVESIKNPGIKILLVETCVEVVEDRAGVELSRGGSNICITTTVLILMKNMRCPNSWRKVFYRKLL